MHWMHWMAAMATVAIGETFGEVRLVLTNRRNETRGTPHTLCLAAAVEQRMEGMCHAQASAGSGFLVPRAWG